MNWQDRWTQEYLQQKFNYDERTGRLFWWKGGKEAGTIMSRKHTTSDGNSYIKSYRRVWLDGMWVMVHRVVWGMHRGPPGELEIDHQDGDGLNNRLRNLRLATSEMNGRNKQAGTKNSAGYPGVTYNEISNTWSVAVRVHGKKVGLGNYLSRSDAIDVRKRAELLLKYHENHGKAGPAMESKNLSKKLKLGC